MDIAFRLYNNGQRLILVAFPEQGGKARLRKSWDLKSIYLRSNETPDRRDMKFGTHKIPNRKSLVRGGFLLDINYDKERITVTPRTRQKNSLDSKSIVYRFDNLGLRHKPELDQFNRNRIELKATLDRLPVKKD